MSNFCNLASLSLLNYLLKSIIKGVDSERILAAAPKDIATFAPN
jgi:hypothetical protein